MNEIIEAYKNLPEEISFLSELDDEIKYNDIDHLTKMIELLQTVNKDSFKNSFTKQKMLGIFSRRSVFLYKEHLDTTKDEIEKKIIKTNSSRLTAEILLNDLYQDGEIWELTKERSVVNVSSFPETTKGFMKMVIDLKIYELIDYYLEDINERD